MADDQDSERFEGLLGAPPGPAVVVDAAGRVCASNGALEAWLGSDVVELDLWDLVVDSERAILREVSTSGWLGANELTFTLTTGRHVALRCHGAAPGRTLVVLHDITTRAVLDKAIEHRRRMDALSDLAGAIARDLNDPMSIVQGRLELLLELGLADPESTRRHLAVALEHAGRISATLRNLRLVGRATVPRLEAMDVADVIEQSLVLLGSRRDRVVVDVEPPSLEAGGAEAMVARVVANLLRQAIDTSARGPLDLVARRRPEGVVLTVGRTRRGAGPSTSTDAGDLTIDDTLLRSVGARVRLAPQGEAWFEVVLRLPPARRARARRVEGRLLVVGSEAFSETVCALLDKDGFSFVGHRDALSALAELDNPDVSIDAVVAQLFLKVGMSGLSLAGEALRRHPRLVGRVVLVSDAELKHLPDTIVPVDLPLQRATLLEALGRRVRRR